MPPKWNTPKESVF
uniref:Uncharacterized protein n=1 Tax=Rhizophora mucronata TaxID=61149 RepID=A0A2P2Q2M0_RHIMU